MPKAEASAGLTVVRELPSSGELPLECDAVSPTAAQSAKLQLRLAEVVPMLRRLVARRAARSRDNALGCASLSASSPRAKWPTLRSTSRPSAKLAPAKLVVPPRKAEFSDALAGNMSP